MNVLENYYAIRGLPPSMARKLALKVVLGHELAEEPLSPGDANAEEDEEVDKEAAGSVDNGPVDGEIEGEGGEGDGEGERGGEEVEETKIPASSSPVRQSPKRANGPNAMDRAIEAMQDAFGYVFQSQFSKHIRITDIPRAEMEQADKEWLRSRLSHDLS